MKETQLNWIRNQLKKSGYITRNQCLQKYVTRLGARIIDLKNEGFNFKAGYTENGDYKYIIIK